MHASAYLYRIFEIIRFELVIGGIMIRIVVIALHRLDIFTRACDLATRAIRVGTCRGATVVPTPTESGMCAHKCHDNLLLQDLLYIYLSDACF